MPWPVMSDSPKGSGSNLKYDPAQYLDYKFADIKGW